VIPYASSFNKSLVWGTLLKNQINRRCSSSDKSPIIKSICSSCVQHEILGTNPFWIGESKLLS